jgi:glucose dehydrogenase
VRPRAFIHRAMALGGSTLRFQACSDRWKDLTFRHTGLESVDLAPWYQRAEDRLKVHGTQPYHRHEPHPLGRASKWMVDAFARAGLQLRPSSVAILSRPEGERSACARLNRCSSGCPTGAKSSYNLAMLNGAGSAAPPPALQILTRAQALRLLPDRDKPDLIRGVEYLDYSNPAYPEGIRLELRAQHFILALGSLETPRLLLLSAHSRAPDGIGNSAGQVGRHVCETLSVALVLLFDEALQSHLGPAMESMADAELDGRECHVTVTQEALRLVTPLDYAQRLTAHPFGQPRVADVLQRYGKAVGILAETGQRPRADNRVTLDTARLDAHRRPVARLESSHNHDDLLMLQNLRALARRVAAESAGKIVEQETSFDAPPGGAELRGSCRIHPDPRHGVVDINQRVHSLQNLFISDASVLPAPGPGNPSLTIAALSLRLADHLVSLAR